MKILKRQLLLSGLVLSAMLTAVVSAEIRYGQEAQKSGTEKSTEYNSEGQLVDVEKTYDNGRLIERKEFDIKPRTLRRKITYKYLKGFKEPDTSTTNYGPDGTTAKDTTNVDHDKDGNMTSTATTNYDGTGKETGGSKQERDSTGRKRCYNWNTAKQVYEEIECPKIFVSGVSMNSPMPPLNENARIEISGGLRIVTFDTPAATVRVNLPDDMRAGDTISGTVIAEPKGNSDDERAKNAASLNGYVVQISAASSNAAKNAGPPPDVIALVDGAWSKYTPSGTGYQFDLPKRDPPGQEGMRNQNIYISRVDVNLRQLGPGETPKLSTATYFLLGQGETAPGKVIATTKFEIFDYPGDYIANSRPVIVGAPTENSSGVFTLPTIGQQGRPVEIIGPFDGNASNTTVGYGPAKSTVQDFEKNTENVSGGFGLIRPLAESPRKAVFTAPPNVTGPIELNLKEGNVETKGTYRNVGVNLSAPKTNLVKGEKTELRVEVTGLAGLKQPVPLTLTYGGVIVMEGGPYQPLVIQPSQVSADGRYSTTRGITGVQTGGWTATATVVTHPFDFCLQDESNPARVILWNSFTGDYNFICPGCLPQTKTGEKSQTGSAAAPTGTSGLVSQTGLSGSGTMTRKGCIITLTHNAPDRRIFSRLDVCTESGNTTVEVPKTNTKFTITDRNTADNTCSMR